MNYVDLHTHSNCSDGSLSPANLVREAMACGLAAIALTDHDTMSGVDEAVAAGKEFGVEVMQGVEISANYKSEPVHIIGYGLDQNHPALQELLSQLQHARKVRNGRILEKLAELKINLNMEELENSSHGLTGRPHIARLLMKYGLVSSVDDAFRRYLKRGAKAFVAAKRFPAEDSIRVITDAGGVAVLAHPTTIDKSISTISEIVRNLTKAGLAGLEAIYPGHSSQTCKELIEIADKFGLLYTGGSDFHGAIKAISLGGAPVMPPVPYKIYENLKERINHP
ncbi:MAG: PHP domain-containing protein [Proteobacteria bacterium]|nr:PHP domain-containing protein [Pseudomonadota bacterium]MBU1738529.1 PHP domain-containing protein [Pseudomonadota bacterium]